MTGTTYGVVPEMPAPLGKEDIQQQVLDLETELAEHRTKMRGAKSKHEKNMARASELRKTLSMLERENMNSEFERMGDLEHHLMGRLQGLNSKLLTINTKSISGGRS